MADRPLLAAFRWRCTLLIRSRSAPAALRVVSCLVAVYSLGGGGRPEYSLTFAPGLPGEPGNVGWSRTLRGASTGHFGRTARNTTGRPSRASRRSPGTKNKARKPNRSTGPPAATRLTGWLIAVRSLPRPRPSRPVDTKSMCPLSVLPSPQAPHPT